MTAFLGWVQPVPPSLLQDSYLAWLVALGAIGIVAAAVRHFVVANEKTADRMHEGFAKVVDAVAANEKACQGRHTLAEQRATDRHEVITLGISKAADRTQATVTDLGLRMGTVEVSVEAIRREIDAKMKRKSAG